MRKRRGFTLVETMLAITIMAGVFAVAGQMTVSIGKSFKRTSTQLDVDERASLAVQWITRDLQEAKTITIMSTTKLKVWYPIQDANGVYDRTSTDPANPIVYYRANANGDENATGDRLVRLLADGSWRFVCYGVDLVEFTSNNPSSVDVSLATRRRDYGSDASCRMIHRAIFLRNY